MNTVELLEAARAKIAEPERWTQEYDARDKGGADVDFGHSDAVCWCAAGALGAVACEDGGLDGVAFDMALKALNDSATAYRIEPGTHWWPEVRYQAAIAQANDHKSGDRGADHARVLAIFDRAIAAERKAA